MRQRDIYAAFSYLWQVNETFCLMLGNGSVQRYLRNSLLMKQFQIGCGDDLYLPNRLDVLSNYLSGVLWDVSEPIGVFELNIGQRMVAISARVNNLLLRELVKREPFLTWPYTHN